MKNQPIVKFRISTKYKDKHLNCPFLFHIWENDKIFKDEFHPYSYYAATLDNNLETKTSKTIEIHLSQERMSLGYVVHEIYHAVTFWANRHNLDIQSDDINYVDEEICASLCGALVEKFYAKLYKLKFIEFADFVYSKRYINYLATEIK